jgi:hypothetical protein
MPAELATINNAIPSSAVYVNWKAAAVALHLSIRLRLKNLVDHKIDTMIPCLNIIVSFPCVVDEE